MSAMEVNIIRAFAGRALQAFYKHDNEQQATDTDRMVDKQPQIPTDRPKVCYFLMSDLHVCARGVVFVPFILLSCDREMC
jgi:GINS complex subunit 2